MTYSHEMKQQLEASLELLQTTLGADLLGVYLYGSAVVGGLQKYSDIDLLVVINRAMTPIEKSRLMSSLLDISGLYMKEAKRPIEMTIAHKDAVNPWRYPPHCDFQYGEWLRQSLESGITPPPESEEMPDLAILITQALLKSQTLYGAEPANLLAPVPYHDFIKAIIHDLGRLTKTLKQDTRNVLLTLARVWGTLETHEIRSKPAAADWVMNHLPETYHPVMYRAKAICVGVENEHWEDIEALIQPCADCMMNHINAAILKIDADDPNQRILYADLD